MNNTPNTTYLCYQGKVDLKIKIHGKDYIISSYNAGELYLKYIFAKMLTGELAKESVESISNNKISYNKRFIPSYLEIYRQEKGQAEKTFMLIPVSVTSELVDMQNGYYTGVCFTGYISFDNLQEAVDPVKEEAAETKFYLYLFSGEDSTYKQGETYHKIAKINISAEALSYITPGTTATITWTMKLINTEEIVQ